MGVSHLPERQSRPGGVSRVSLLKAIKHGKEKRKPYYKSGRFDRTCRPGGDCPYCQSNRKHAFRKKLLRAKDDSAE